MKIDDSWAVFFDAGHTLLHPKQSVGAVYAEVASHYGVKAEADRLDEGFRQAWEIMKVPAANAGQSIPRDEKLWWSGVVRKTWEYAGGMNTLPFDEYFETVYAAFARPELWQVYPDAWELLDWLYQQKITCGILSNWDDRLRPLLKGHQLANYFSSIMISGELGTAKPDVRIFQMAEASMPSSITHFLLVGDDDECDRDGAAVAGWHFFKVNRPDSRLDHLLVEFKGDTRNK